MPTETSESIDLKDLSSLKRLRGTIKSTLTSTKNWLAATGTSKPSIAELRRRNEYIAQKFDAFNTVQNKIFILDEKETDEYLTKVEELYFEIASTIDELINSLQQNTTSSTESEISEAVSGCKNSNVKLSKLPLPQFSGKSEEWTSFYQRFTNAMNRSDLTDVDRIQYLVSCLKGDAALVIKNIAIIGENYASALELLQKRYDNKRINVRMFLQNLYNLPIVVQNSASSLREMLNAVIINVRALENLAYIRDRLSNELLVQLIVSKLDAKTREGWELHLTTLDTNDDDGRDAYEELIAFLEDRLRILLSVYPNTISPAKRDSKSRTQKTTLAVTAGQERPNQVDRKCAICKKSHALYTCDEFRKLSVPQRYEQVRILKLCINCFGRNHWATQCTSTSKCKQCGALHHTLLHRTTHEANPVEARTDGGVQLPITADQAADPPPATVTTTVTQQKLREVLLATAVVNVTSSSGKMLQAVAVIDGASHASFITKRLQRQLQAPTTKTTTTIRGFGGKASQATATTEVQISPQNGDAALDIVAIVSDRITDPLPAQSFELTPAWDFIKEYELADSEFNKRKEIDLLIGADSLYNILLPEFHKRQNAPTLQASILGWLVIGPYAALSIQLNVHCNLTRTEFSHIERFWEIEEPPATTQKPTDQVACEQHFCETFKRVSGRFEVKLPFNGDQRPAQSRNQALARFRKMKFSEKYHEFMQEYRNLGHMKLAESKSQEGYYIPHHAVEKDGKLRVVFNASMKSSNGLSLNDCLYVGPTIQPPLFETLLRFRTYQFAFTTDICKMYRQIQVSEADQQWQKIFWFDNNEIAEFELTTVTYGTASAPFLAIRSLYQLAQDSRTTHPRAAAILETNCYVDDILTGSNSLEEAIELRDELCDLLATAGMQLGKWRASDNAILPREATSMAASPTTDIVGKALGIQWNSHDDIFVFPAYTNNLCVPLTRRTALSTLGKVFDPLGLLAPLTVTGKLLIQELWTKTTHWDEPLTCEFSSRFEKFLHMLQCASEFVFPRYVGGSNAASLELHAFADASTQAYATCIYVRTEHFDRSISSTLLCAKTRVAPTKTVRTIPELELCAAVLLVETLEPVAKLLQCPIENCYAYSDSTVVLSYLARDASHWKPFVGNRVKKITAVLPVNKWRHIPGEKNPADIATRAKAASEFKARKQLWLVGPEFLSETVNEAEFTEWTEDESALAYLRSTWTSLVTTLVQPKLDLNWVNAFFHRFSSYQRLVRTIAFLLRMKHRSSERIISSQEYQAAEAVIFRLAQAESFPNHVKEKQLSTLNPFSVNGILRVGGRLENADLPYNQRHPVILSASHYVTELYIRDLHRRYFHAGPKFITYLTRLRFWFTGNLSQRITQCIKNCARCIRHQRQQPSAPIMGNLPEGRVRSTYPFDTVGIDFAGPLTIRQAARAKTTLKAYVAVFVCFTSKAVHLETVSDLSTPAFLAALKRFAARRGYPSVIHSDNGTNFVGGASVLVKQTEELLKSEAVQNFASMNQITWRFNPPAAPHMGGLWEAAVRSAKFHLYRITSPHTLNFEELTTLLCQIEAILNSRPLTKVHSSDAPRVLTPGHFLIGRPLVCVPDATSVGTKLNLTQRWTLLSQIRVNFWREWQRDYLVTLQRRSKWSTESPAFKVNDVVLLRESTPPLVWPLARISQIYPGRDGVIRVVDVVTSNGKILHRPIVKLVRLVDSEEES